MSRSATIHACRKAIEDHIADNGMVTAPNKLLRRLVNAIEGEVPARKRTGPPVRCVTCKRVFHGQLNRLGDKYSGWVVPPHKCLHGRTGTHLGELAKGGA